MHCNLKIVSSPDPNLLQVLHVDCPNATDLSGFSQLQTLNRLSLIAKQASLSNELENATELTNVRVSVKDISQTALTNLNKLKDLSLEVPSLEDISFLSQHQSIRRLRLTNTNVSDISPLASLPNLESVKLDNTQVNDISPLTKLDKTLEALTLDNTPVEDFSPFAKLTNLRSLSQSGTSFSDPRQLPKLDPRSNGCNLNLANTMVSSLEWLDERNLDRLNLSGCPIEDFTPLRIIWIRFDLNLNNTSISDLSPLQSQREVRTIEIKHTNVTDPSPVEELKKLDTLYIAGSKVSAEEIRRFKKIRPDVAVISEE